MKRAVNIVVALLILSKAYSQPLEDKIEFIFNLNGYTVDSTIADNAQSIRSLTDLINNIEHDSTLSLTSITVDSYASPDGDGRYNQKLSARRSQSLYNYLHDDLSVADSLITVNSRGVAWEHLREMVLASDMDNRDQVVDIIDNVPVETWRRINPSDRWQTLVDSRNKHLMDLACGEPYRYMLANFYPHLRSASVVTIYFKRQAVPVITRNIAMRAAEPAEMNLEIVAIPIVSEPVVSEPIMSKAVVSAPIEQTEEIPAVVDITPAPAPAPTPAPAPEQEKKPIRFALKTNLLFDALLAPNIELEVPIGNRWSVAGEWIFPWWVTKNNGYAFQLLSGQVEGRYWFGEREKVPQLTGWFAGLYAGGGLYDLQWKNNGYQGEFYIAAGLSGGYAHTINKKGNLRMEYSLGLGYLSTDYRYYEGQLNNEYLVWRHNGRYTWLGPTKAKVSLVWYFDWKRGGKR